MDGFCNSTFFDPAVSWNTEDPDFTLCFEKTALVWAPCLLLWLLSPLDIHFILVSKCRDVPWGFLNTSKLVTVPPNIASDITTFVLNIVLIGLSVVSLVQATVLYLTSPSEVYAVDIWTPVIQTATFMLALIFLLWQKIRGIQTSGVLFVFWLALAVAGLAQFRTEIKHQSQDSMQDSMFHFVMYMIYYPVVVVLCVLNFFADKPPRKVNYPRSKKTSPQVGASFISRLFFHWFDEMVWKGFKKPLELSNLWDLRHSDTSSQVIHPFEKQLSKARGHSRRKQPEVEKNGFSSTDAFQGQQPYYYKPVSVLRLIFKVYWKQFLTGGLFAVVGDVISFINPIILSLLIQFVAGKEFMWRGLLYAVGMFVASETKSFCFHHNLMTMSVLGLNIRTALISSIYTKTLRISSAARKQWSEAEISNLMSIDAQKFIEFTAFFYLMYSCPVMVVLSMCLLCHFLGPAAFAGLGVMVILILLNIVLSTLIKKLKSQQMMYKDQRMKLMNNILCGVKVLKFYAWEPSFQEKLMGVRQQELMVLWKMAILRTSAFFLSEISSYLVSFASFLIFVLSDDSNILTPEIAFVSMTIFNLIRMPILMVAPSVEVVIQTIVSANRINKFLNAEEFDAHCVSHDEAKEEPLIIENGSFSWGSDEGDTAVLQNINLKVKTGSLVAVVGAVGSGKSSLISAFLGEMDKVSGYINTKGKLAYVPQQAWIQNATVKDNILFGSSYDSKRYHRTVSACALQQDFDMLPGGDLTEIGEKGINLSGGQKQRVSLARAVYNDADTYLLDDPLSAVDSHVGKHIFDNVIGSRGILSKKTRLMVTHAVTFLPKVDVIVVVKEGHITETGTFQELLAKGGEFSEFLAEHTREEQDSYLEPDIKEPIKDCDDREEQAQRRLSAESVKSTTSSPDRDAESIGKKYVEESVKADLPSAKLIKTEKTEVGSVKGDVYSTYLRSFGWLLSVVGIGSIIVAEMFFIGSNLWISLWTGDKTAVDNGLQVDNKRDYYLWFYAAFGLIHMLFKWAGEFGLAFGSVLASRWLHHSMVSRVLRAPMVFFDTTPVGTIMNRFGKDVDVVDNILPASLLGALNCIVMCFGTLALITYATPIFAVVIIPIGLLYFFLQKIYEAVARQLKRMEAVTRSAIYSHFSDTISGASSIRAYHVEHRFIRTSQERVDINQMCLYPSMVSNRWLGIRLDTMGNLVIFFASLFAVLSTNLSASIMGLSVSYAIRLTVSFGFAVRMMSEMRTNMVSVERIKEYLDLPQEAAWRTDPQPHKEWPDVGSVQFDDYQVRYRPGLDLVLRGITFTVHGGEKVGIVGRTGAGKSSLTLGLFRILEAAGGHIYIDGIDISKMGLGDLRSKLTIIPQDPFLFSGTLQMNLDPFDKFSSSELWRVLELVHLSDFVRSLAEGLNSHVTEGGQNLSVGQRQLICLARALLRKTKVLILDEATAAIDLDTDDLIQQTIRVEFKHCTVLTIAHRLNTIMDSDRVIVLDKGKIKEFDSPQNLLKLPTTVFYSMAKDAGLL